MYVNNCVSPIDHTGQSLQCINSIAPARIKWLTSRIMYAINALSWLVSLILTFILISGLFYLPFSKSNIGSHVDPVKIGSDIYMCLGLLFLCWVLKYHFVSFYIVYLFVCLSILLYSQFHQHVLLPQMSSRTPDKLWSPTTPH